MPSTAEQLSPTRVKLTVEIPFTDLKPHLDRAYKSIAGQVNIPGFRKGKVPSTVIDQRFGRGAVLQEAINEAIPQAYQAAVAEAQVYPMAQPEIDVTKLEDNELVEFVAEVDVRPSFDLPDFAAVKAVVDAAEVTDEIVNERIELLRERFATTTQVERAAKEGDILVIDLVASQNGEILEDATAEGISYKVGDEQNMLAGLDDAVTGLSAGDSAEFSTTLLGGAYQDQEADVKVTVVKVQEQELPELDDDFAQLISEFDTVEEMRADLTKGIEQQLKNEQLADARDKVLEEALKLVDFELPESVLEADKQARRQQVERQLTQYGLSVEQYLETAEDETAETEEEFWATIEDRGLQALRAQVLLDAYGDANELEVSQQDLTEMIFRKAQQNNTSPQDEVNHMMEHNHMGEWMQEIRRTKALTAICAAATVEDSNGAAVEFPSPVVEPEAADEVDLGADEIEVEGDEN
ncbi:trigger factor [Tessaracoccus caeni]|uniref:trigger factor n=1 Tax=Tessaracoccus caeni TaxID=3031239 RepID=UPI0029E821F1|nr:trigger factor [Tessaracoccus caeni]